MNIYVVTAFRWGGRENHSYLVSVHDNERDALKSAEDHEAHRGGNKYECEVARMKFGNGDEIERETIKRIYSDTLTSPKEKRCLWCGADHTIWDKAYWHDSHNEKKE